MARGEMNEGARILASDDDESAPKSMAQVLSEERQEEAFRNIFESVNDCMIYIDRSGRILEVNEKAVQVFGGSKEELIGKHFTKVAVVSPRDIPRLVSGFASALAGRNPTVDVCINNKKGQEIHLECSTTVVKKDDQLAGVMIIARDITERKRAEEEIRRRSEELAALNAIAETVSQSLDLSHIFNSALDKVLEIMRVEAGGIYLVDEASQRLTLMAHRGVSEEFVRQMGVLDIEKKVLERVAKRGRLRRLILVSEQILKDTTLLRATTTAIAREKLRSYVQVLIHVKGSPAGLLVLASQESRKFTAEEEQLLSTIANQIGVAIQNARLFRDMRAQNLQTITALATAAETRDPYTSGHSQKVTEYAIAIAKKMDLSAEEIENLRMAGLLHDIGKIAIPSSILNKPARLTSAERMMVEAHPGIAAEIVGKIEALAHLVPVIRHHHEGWDGKGYPDGLKGEEIPLLARILAVVDGFEALTSERPYRRGMSTQEALAAVQEGAGKQWDAKIVKVFCRMLDQGEIPRGKVDDSE